jgi:heme/copper-type cytochrome/quinol oxidase subunit 4
MKGSFKIGQLMAIDLGVLTILDYTISKEIGNHQVRFVFLSILAFAEAVPIAYYFMHISRLWRRDEH